ncbi:hypothetical protein B0H94_1204 [Salsuginibacillus halophilus]|uniref:Uncharacterized protein n=1 Tax=Salsuginibacillus halophilus TaxID=517424 RepID=A0A2P8H4W7_9BACI|nr:hypothetical protein [Salsuginibacillus halophilus]PSL41258.1 hypothetical protein B0H94_1204 [Salsuginibacillus halophilus]
MSNKVDDIKNRKRNQSNVSPSEALNQPIDPEETVEEENVSRKEGKKMTTNQTTKIERKRVSFDLRTDLHKRMKMQALQEERNIYEIIEEAVEAYLEENE